MAYRALHMEQAAPGMYMRQGNTYTLVVMWALVVDVGSGEEGHEYEHNYEQDIVGLTHFDLAINLSDALEDAVARKAKGVTYTTQVPKTENLPAGAERPVINR